GRVQEQHASSGHRLEAAERIALAGVDDRARNPLSGKRDKAFHEIDGKVVDTVDPSRCQGCHHSRLAGAARAREDPNGGAGNRQSSSFTLSATGRGTTPVSSSTEALRIASTLPNWRSSARRRTGPRPGTM